MVAARLSLVMSLIAICVGAPSLGWAQAYPNKPIKLIVPVAAGGPVDALARLVSHHLSLKFNQTVVVENQPGAGGIMAAVAAATAEPDGYTLLMGSSSTLFIAPVLFKVRNFDPSSLAPVVLVAKLPLVLVVRPDVPATTVAELVAYMKAHPGKLNFGAALGTSPHLMGEFFMARAGVEALFIPYKGAAPSIADLLGGTTQFTIDALTVLRPLITDNKVRPLAVIHTTRVPILPGVPTMVESGYPGFDLLPFFGLLAPARTPPVVINTINTAVNEWLSSSEAQQVLDQFGGAVQVGSPEDFGKYVLDVAPKWAELLRRSAIGQPPP